MKKLVVIISIILFAGFNVLLLNGQDKTEKKEKNKTEMKSCDSKKGCCKSGAKEEKVSLSKAWNEVCPVKGGKVDSEVATAEYNGKTYGFCCEGCDSKFQKDPAKYSKNLSEDGKTFVSN